MAPLRMVHLASLPTPFEAQVLAARLGAEGIVWELRGVDSLYPVGSIHVLVDAESAERARELLLVDELEAVFADDGEDGEPLRLGRYDGWTVVVAALLLSLFVARLLWL